MKSSISSSNKLYQATSTSPMLSLALISSLLIFSTQGCTTSRYKEVETLSSKGSCEEASIKFVQSQHGANIGEKIQTTTGQFSSYGLSAVGYTADTVIVGALGIVLIATICSPSLLLAVAVGSNNLSCIPLGKSDDQTTTQKSSPKLETSYGVGIGDGINEGTQVWRENPAVEQFSFAIRNIASCYQSRGDTPNLIKAQSQLDQLRNSSESDAVKSDSIYSLASKTEQSKIDAQSEEIVKQLLAIDPEYLNKLKREKELQMELLLKEHRPELWRDFATGRYWRFHRAAVPSPEQAENLCAHAKSELNERWSMPTVAEVKTAVANGLTSPNKNRSFITAQKFSAKAYIKDRYDTFKLVNLQNGELTDESKSNNPNSGLLCIF